MLAEGSSAWFIKYGGPAFWQDFSERFYHKVTLSPILKKYFAHLSEDRVREIASDMWQVILGFTGPMSASAIEHTHAGLNISEYDFEQYVVLMKATLFEMGVELEDIYEIEEKVGETKTLVCGQRVT